MSQLHETFAKPKPSSSRARWITAGIAAVAGGALFFGPGTWHSYQDGRAIEQKRGPAKTYVTKTLGELVLNGHPLHKEISGHACNRGPQYTPGEISRYCKVSGESSYVIAAKDYMDAYTQAGAELQQHHIARGTHTTMVDGQNLDVFTDFSVRTAQSYNNSFERNDTDPKIPDGTYAITYDVIAYTLKNTAPEYRYNDETP